MTNIRTILSLTLSASLLTLSYAIVLLSTEVRNARESTLADLNTQLSAWHKDLPQTLESLTQTTTAISELNAQLEQLTPTSEKIIAETSAFRTTALTLSEETRTLKADIPVWIKQVDELINKAHTTTIEAGKISENNVDGIIKGIVTSPVTAITAILTAPEKASEQTKSKKITEKDRD